MSDKKDMINPEKMPTSAAAIQRLARNKFSKTVKTRRVAGSPSTKYKDGDPLEKVWDNYQLTKGLKRDFKELCKKKGITASKYLRACIKILIEKDGDTKKSLGAVKKIELDKLND